jgi:hypothetical protein
MASTYGSLRQRLPSRSASARLPAHSAWLQAAMPLSQRLLGEMDHETVRINMARAAALVHPPVTVNDLELEAQDYFVMKWPVTLSATQLGEYTKLRCAAGKAFLVFLLAWPCLSDLLF